MKRKLLLFIIAFASISGNAQNVGVNTTTPQAALDVNGDMILRASELTIANGITLALDVNTLRFSYYRLTGPTADFTIAGIVAGIDGRLVTFFNRSGFAMQLNNEDATAAAGDRIVTGTGADMIIPNKGMVNLQYDGAEQQWIVKSSNKGGGSVTGGYWDSDGTHIYNNNIGNVGIGTITPLDKLTVETDNNSYGITHRSIQGNILSTRIGGTTAGIGTFSPTDMRIFSGGISRIYINQATGEVSIGTDDVTVGNKLAVRTANNSLGITHFGDNGNVLATRMGGSTAGIGTFSATDMRLYSGGISRVYINQASGEVSIGTDDVTVGNKLAVRTANNSLGITHFGDDGNILATRMGGTSAGIGTFSNTNMRLFCNSASAFIIDAANGNIGIGTENTSIYKLSVNGNIRSKEVVVEAAPWPDYVFDNTYKLKPLDEVEQFISIHKRLPNIPSAKEIEEKGLPLGDIQKRMMEKIEELTLYIIEQDKQIKALRKEIDQSKKTNQ